MYIYNKRRYIPFAAPVAPAIEKPFSLSSRRKHLPKSGERALLASTRMTAHSATASSKTQKRHSPLSTTKHAVCVPCHHPQCSSSPSSSSLTSPLLGVSSVDGPRQSRLQSCRVSLRWVHCFLSKPGRSYPRVQQPKTRDRGT